MLLVRGIISPAADMKSTGNLLSQVGEDTDRDSRTKFASITIDESLAACLRFRSPRIIPCPEDPKCILRNSRRCCPAEDKSSRGKHCAHFQAEPPRDLLMLIWWTRWDSNPRPPHCERGIIEAKTRRHNQLAFSNGRELPNSPNQIVELLHWPSAQLAFAVLAHPIPPPSWKGRPAFPLRSNSA